jgi:hypothetical protein
VIAGPAIPTPKRPLVRPVAFTGNPSAFQPCLEGGEQRDCRDRGQAVDVDLAHLLENETLVRGEQENLAGARAFPGVTRENGSALDVELLLLEVGEDLPGAQDHFS